MAKQIKLAITNEALDVLMMIPPHSKKRIARIRRNLFREIKALNKEIQRHKSRPIYDPNKLNIF